MMSMVSVIGTALSIFLIMVVVMLQDIKVASLAPESNRDRFLHVSGVGLDSDGGRAHGPLSYSTIKQCFGDLETPEAVTFYTIIGNALVSLPGASGVSADLRHTDNSFWNVFDFRFIDGKPYDKAAFDAGQPVAVISRTMARRLFGSVDVSGREFMLNHAPYRVAGVVEDVSTVASKAYAQVWVPFTSTGCDDNSWNNGIMGILGCTILARSQEDFDAIRRECENRRAAFSATLEGSKYKQLVYYNRPYDQETEVQNLFMNLEPDMSAVRIRRYAVYLILLIVPAINLSSMTHSRLRRRTMEIGVRRAFGCPRSRLMRQVIAENMTVTVAAGMIGLGLSVLFAMLCSGELFMADYSRTSVLPDITLGMLLRPATFMWTLVFCFILNLLVSGVPAWQASRIDVADSLRGYRD